MKSLKLLFICMFSQVVVSQVGIGTTAPHPSSILHLNSVTSGFLVPRLTSVQKASISAPATGLLIYQTDGVAGFWYYNGTAWVTFGGGGGGTSYTFNNGLTLTGSTAQLGGTLIKNTTIDLGNNDLTFRTTSTSSFPGEFTLQGTNREIMQTGFKDDYVHFGGWAFLGTSVDGTTLTTTGGDNYTLDVVAGFQSDGAIGGTCVKMGSVEHIMDGISELYVDAPGGFHPREDQTSSFGCTLGASSKRWAAVYANNGVIQTSDIRLKKNIKQLSYGLKEIMSLNPIAYNWKEGNKVGKTTVQDSDLDLKLGLSAQELLRVVPEVVETHSWVPSDEEGNFKKIKNEKLGVNYSELIPVLINAIKEQQKEIDTLKELIIKQQKQ